MPRTRNVSRSQWTAANAGSDSKPTKENGYGSEKENASRSSRTTRSRAAGHRTVLGTVGEAVPTPNAASTTSKTTKGKGKPPGKPTLTKAEKLPLQDITSRFLPAPESENRGHAQPTGFGPPENLVLSSTTAAGPSTVLRAGRGDLPVRNRTTMSRQVYPSSLPPSSPPSLSSNTHARLPVLSRSPTPVGDPVSRRLFDEPREAPAVSDAWKELDFAVPDSEAGQARPRPTSRNSDPFGFFALERKLEAEREEEEEAVDAIVLAKDTSPGLEYTDAYAEGHSEAFLHLPPLPPTPHKRGVIPRRESYTSIVSPASSCPSSPSPTKPQAPSSKRKAADFDAIHDEPAGSTPHVPRQSKRVKKVVVEIKVLEEEKETKPVLRRSRRGNKKLVVEEEEVAESQPGPSRKSRSAKSSTTTKRTRSKVKKETTTTKSKKTAILPEPDSDAEEVRFVSSRSCWIVTEFFIFE